MCLGLLQMKHNKVLEEGEKKRGGAFKLKPCWGYIFGAPRVSWALRKMNEIQQGFGGGEKKGGLSN